MARLDQPTAWAEERWEAGEALQEETYLRCEKPGNAEGSVAALIRHIDFHGASEANRLLALCDAGKKPKSRIVLLADVRCADGASLRVWILENGELFVPGISFTHRKFFAELKALIKDMLGDRVRIEPVKREELIAPLRSRTTEAIRAAMDKPGLGLGLGLGGTESNPEPEPKPGQGLGLGLGLGPDRTESNPEPEPKLEQDITNIQSPNLEERNRLAWEALLTLSEHIPDVDQTSYKTDIEKARRLMQSWCTSRELQTVKLPVPEDFALKDICRSIFMNGKRTTQARLRTAGIPKDNLQSWGFCGRKENPHIGSFTIDLGGPKLTVVIDAEGCMHIPGVPGVSDTPHFRHLHLFLLRTLQHQCCPIETQMQSIQFATGREREAGAERALNLVLAANLSAMSRGNRRTLASAILLSVTRKRQGANETAVRSGASSIETVISEELLSGVHAFDFTSFPAFVEVGEKKRGQSKSETHERPITDFCTFRDGRNLFRIAALVKAQIFPESAYTDLRDLKEKNTQEIAWEYLPAEYQKRILKEFRVRNAAPHITRMAFRTKELSEGEAAQYSSEKSTLVSVPGGSGSRYYMFVPNQMSPTQTALLVAYNRGKKEPEQIDVRPGWMPYFVVFDSKTHTLLHHHPVPIGRQGNKIIVRVYPSEDAAASSGEAATALRTPIGEIPGMTEGTKDMEHLACIIVPLRTFWGFWRGKSQSLLSIVGTEKRLSRDQLFSVFCKMAGVEEEDWRSALRGNFPSLREVKATPTQGAHILAGILREVSALPPAAQIHADDIQTLVSNFTSALQAYGKSPDYEPRVAETYAYEFVKILQEDGYLSSEQSATLRTELEGMIGKKEESGRETASSFEMTEEEVELFTRIAWQKAHSSRFKKPGIDPGDLVQYAFVQFMENPRLQRDLCSVREGTAGIDMERFFRGRLNNLFKTYIFHVEGRHMRGPAAKPRVDLTPADGEAPPWEETMEQPREIPPDVAVDQRALQVEQRVIRLLDAVREGNEETLEQLVATVSPTQRSTFRALLRAMRRILAEGVGQQTVVSEAG